MQDAQRTNYDLKISVALPDFSNSQYEPLPFAHSTTITSPKDRMHGSMIQVEGAIPHHTQHPMSADYLNKQQSNAPLIRSSTSNQMLQS